MENETMEYRFENIDKCIGRIDDQLCEHDKRIIDLEKADIKVFERLGALIKVLWVLAVGILSAITYAFMQLILK